MESRPHTTSVLRRRAFAGIGGLAFGLAAAAVLATGCDGKPAAAPSPGTGGTTAVTPPSAAGGTQAPAQPRPGGSDTVERRVEPKAVAMLDRYLSLLDSPANAGVKEMSAVATLDLGFRDAYPTLDTRWTPAGPAFTARMPAMIDEMMPPEMVVPVTKTMNRLIGERFVGPVLTSLLPDLRDYEILHREADGRPFVKLFAARPGPAWDRLEIRFDDAGLITGMIGTVRADKDDPLSGAYGGASDVRIDVAHARRGDLWVLSEIHIAATAARWDAKVTWIERTSKPALASEIRYTNSMMPGERTATFPEWNVDGRKVAGKTGAADGGGQVPEKK